MKKLIHNYRYVQILGTLLVLSSIMGFTVAQNPIPAITLPEKQVVVAMEVEQGPIQATPVVTENIPAQAPQTVNPEPLQPEEKKQDEEIPQDVADLAWLTYISNAACMPPLPDHSHVAAQLNNPNPGNIITSLIRFTLNTFTEFLHAGINADKPNAEAEFPHARKLLVKPDDEIYFVGDIHGGIGALVRLMWLWHNMGLLDKNFKIPQHKYLVFLGDYTDYGTEGILVLYTLINLKLNNWDNIIMLRGNHESIPLAMDWGFAKELVTKYGQKNGSDILRYCNSGFFGLLPNVLYIGLDNQHSFIQCCHGGIEPGFNPKAFLESNATFYDLTDTFEHYQFDETIMTIIEPDHTKREDLKNSLLQKMVTGHLLHQHNNSYSYPSGVISGFQWSDMITKATFGFNDSRGCGFVASKELMSQIGQACKICAYIRGHQHNLGVKIGDMERGIAAANARWYKAFKLQKNSASVKFELSTPLTLNLTTPNAYQALHNIEQLLAQPSVNRQDYTNAWQDFKINLPYFKFSTFAPCLPIITLTTASEAAVGRIYNPWDSFGLCTIKTPLEESEFAIYEAEASAHSKALVI